MDDLIEQMAEAMRGEVDWLIQQDENAEGLNAADSSRQLAISALGALKNYPRWALVELPEPTGSESGAEDENGFVEWEYPHGTVQVFDGGVIGWGRWHFEDAQKLRDAAAALLAAANKAEETP